jgi:LDH2 family malate/lactate/ureidoglycolate dehydrogenase
MPDVLENFVTDLFVSAGFNKIDAALIANSLVQSDLRGVESHGVMRIPVYIKRIKQNLILTHSRGQIVKDSGATSIINAGNGMGQLMAYQGMELAIQKAKEFGIGLTGINHSNHFGAAAYYSSMAVEQGMIGIVCTNTLPLMPPPGGSKAVVGNNPIAIGVPTRRYKTMILDMAMSAAAVGKVMMAQKKGESIPKGWALDSNGNDTTDPNEALKAALYLPIGGPKGFGLALMIDVLSGALLNSAVGNEVKSLTSQWKDPVDCGHLMIVINVEALLNLETFTSIVDQMIDSIKESTPLTGLNTPPMYPGEPEHRCEEKRRKEGIPLSEKVYQELIDCAKENHVDISTIESNLY